MAKALGTNPTVEERLEEGSKRSLNLLREMIGEDDLSACLNHWSNLRKTLAKKRLEHDLYDLNDQITEQYEKLKNMEALADQYREEIKKFFD